MIITVDQSFYHDSFVKKSYSNNFIAHQENFIYKDMNLHKNLQFSYNNIS